MEKILEPIYGVKLDFLIVDQTGKVVDGDYIRYDVQKCMRTTIYSANVDDLKRVRDRKLNRDQILLDLPPLCFRDVNGNDIEFDSNPKTMMLFAQIISSFYKEFGVSAL